MPLMSVEEDDGEDVWMEIGADTAGSGVLLMGTAGLVLILTLRLGLRCALRRIDDDPDLIVRVI